MTSTPLPRPRLCHVGGEDVHARIPLLQKLSADFTPLAVGSDGSPRFQGTGISFHQYTLNRTVSPLADMKSVRELRTLFKTIRPDIVHAFDTKPAIYAMSAATQAGVPVRMRTITGMGYLFSEDTAKTRILRPFWTLMQRRVARHVGWTVFQNSTDRDYFHKHRLISPDRSSIIRGSGIDEAHLRQATVGEAGLAALRRTLGLADAPVVMMAARLVIQKGVREFIDAARLLYVQRPEVRFLLVGPADGEGREAISTAELSAVPPNVMVTGKRSDMVPLLQLADIFVLPSYYREGVPRVLMEAALMHSAIITTDTPGCRDVIDDGRFGMLVPPRDANSLALSIGEMLDKPRDVRDAMTKEAADHVRSTFSLDRVAGAYHELYGSLLQEAGRAGIA